MRNILIFSILANQKKEPNQKTMTQTCNLYKSQYNKATETLKTLLKQREEIDSKLKINPISSDLHKDLRTINLEIKITNNEIEQAESDILECESTENVS